MTWDQNKYEIVIGIDCGVSTGFAVWNKTDKRFDEIATLKIHGAMFRVKQMYDKGYKLMVRVEDARLRKWFGNAGKEQLQGAGSVKRDAKVWEDFLTDYKIPHEMVAPKNNKTKLSKDVFARLTGYSGLTSVHGRDGAMLVYQY